MDGRRRTARSLANDVIVRQAVVEEIVASGVDSVGPTAVARRAGFTTGAVYGRYENSIEMVVDTWLEELWPRQSALLDGVVGDLAGIPTDGRLSMFDWARCAVAVGPVDLAPLESLEVGELVVDTGDPARDRLVRACIEVIADVRFERATTSRIARRAGVGTNWVYLDHDSKQELLAEVIDVLVYSLVTPEAVNALVSGRDLTTPLGAASVAIGTFVHPTRRTVRLTRLEALLCARHHPGVAEVLAGMWRQVFDSHAEAAGLADPGLAEASRPVLHYLDAQLSGLAVLDALAGPLSDVDWRYGLVPFEGVAVAAWRGASA